VKATKGSASERQCPCGKQAQQWAYSHADPSQKADSHGKEKGKPYSPNVEHYPVALCRSCHRRMDEAHARTSGGGLSLPHVSAWTARQEVAA
jgi:hypothetical protein